MPLCSALGEGNAPANRPRSWSSPSACARGVPNYPDPTYGKNGVPNIPDFGTVGINTQSPAFTNAVQQCNGRGIPLGGG